MALGLTALASRVPVAPRDRSARRALVPRRLVDHGGAERRSIYEDLEGHEGYATRRLPDGTTTCSWTAETATFTSYVAACECDWRGGDHAPTEMGYEEALDDWDRRHAQPLVAQAIPGNVKAMLREVKEVLADLVDVRPAAGLKAVREVEEWARAVGARAMGPEHGAPSRSAPDRHRRRF